MNRTELFSKTPFLLCLFGIGAFGQNQSKTFTERFNIGDDTVLEINTSHTDIEFETWNNNEVVIEATIELTDMSEEEAASYFEKSPISIMGNSQKIEVSTRAGHSLFSSNTFGDVDFHFDMGSIDPVIVDVPELDHFLEVIALHEMPSLPVITLREFDYEEYEKRGEDYMKEWQAEFSKDFDKEHQKKIEEWGKRVEERAKRMKERNDKMKARAAERAQKLKDRAKERAERHKEIREKRIAAIKERAERRNEEVKNRFLFIDNDGNRFDDPTIFYFNSDRFEGNIKVKKIIKIKMPKSVKLKINVRHGEVKLAENTENLKATLSHARLLASTIDGNDTAIIASYSPVSVEKWNYGHLQADYSDDVWLNEVRNMTLTSTSSDITIGLLLDQLNTDNSFGPIKINAISKNFSDLNVSLRNAELMLELPNTAFGIKIKSTLSKLNAPASLTLNKTVNGSSIFHEGHHLKNSSDKSIVINSNYSEVAMSH